MTVGRAIGIDIGTSGVRAILIDESCNQIARGDAALKPDQRRQPATWWESVCVALQALASKADLSGVHGLAVDGTSGTVLAIDNAGRPLGQAQMYNDPAEPELVAAIGAAGPPESAAHGGTSALGRAIALQRTAGMARVLHQADWILGQLCGRYDISDSNNALKTGFDPVERCWPNWLASVGMRATALPHVLSPGSVVAPIRTEIAARFGLPAATRVVTGTTDGCASFLATGAETHGTGVTALGSTLTLKLLSDRPVFAPDFGIYSHRLGDAWLPGGASNSGGAVLAQFFTPDRLTALSDAIDPSRDSGCAFYPLPKPGERFPINDPALPPRMNPRPADDAVFLHGLLEGIARIEALGYRRLQELGAPPVLRVLTVGGGAANRVWTAIRARVLGVPVQESVSADAALGAARLALRAA